MIDPRLLDAVGALIAEAERPGYVPLIGIAGAQGSGKSTLAKTAAQAFGAATLSLDDVYRTRAERARMGREIHPLFAVRGPPGTHDLDLLARTLDALAVAGEGDATPLPAFDKLADDRRPDGDWPVFRGRPRAIVLEGWSLGATAQDEAALAAPVNGLEREQDSDGLWRGAVNRALAGDYAGLHARLDGLLFLKAPSFEVVPDWRCEQEAGLLGVSPDRLSPERRHALTNFIQYFERITRHMLAGGVRADVVAALDPDRLPLTVSRVNNAADLPKT